jgi:hypothetical protein
MAFFFSALSVRGQAMTPEELADRMEAEFDRLQECVSYLYQVHTETLSATPKAQGGKGRFYRSTHLVERKGELHREARTWSNRHDDRESAKSAKAPYIQVQSFDGRRMRYNLIQGGASFRQKSNEIVTPLRKLTSFEEILKGFPHSGKSAIHGYFESEPKYGAGGYGLDYFMEAIAFVNVRGVPPSAWHAVLRNGTAQVEKVSDGIVEVEGSRYGTPDWIAANWKVSAESAETIAKKDRFRLTVDTTKSYRIVHALLTQNGTDFAELRDVELEENADKEIWYPKRFFRIIHGGQTNEFELKETSFEPFPDTVFEEIWVDDQEIRDRVTGAVYYRDPTLKQRMDALWDNIQVWVGLKGGPARSIPRRLPIELGGTAPKGSRVLLTVLFIGALLIVICCAAVWRSYRKQVTAGKMP